MTRINYLSPDIPTGMSRVTVPVVAATTDSLAGASGAGGPLTP
jgi:hypothetical protein